MFNLDADNPINQTILSTFLRKKQLAHEVAKNGEEAVERWRAGDFGLILVRVVTYPVGSPV
jgi:osomolarity two-component system response regulator SSK1